MPVWIATALIDTRFPVQFVIRPYQDEFHDYRGYAGRVAGGVLKKGDKTSLELLNGFNKGKSFLLKL